MIEKLSSSPDDLPHDHCHDSSHNPATVSIVYEFDQALHGGDKKSRGVNQLITFVFDLGLGVGGFYIAKHFGVSNVHAYLIAALGPLLSLIIMLIRSHVLSIFSLGLIAIQLIGVALTFVVGKHEKWLLYKDGILSLVISMILLASTVVFRPAFFYIFQRFNSDGTKAGFAAWENLWRYQHIQIALRKITFLWGIIVGCEGIFKIITTAQLSFSSSFLINTVAPTGIVFIGAIVTSAQIAKVRQQSQEIDQKNGIIFLDALDA